MAARGSAAAARSGFAAWGLALLAALLLFALAVGTLSTRDTGTTRGGVAVAPSPRVAYLSFGPDADTLWLADAADPARHEALRLIEHAPGFGVVPSLAPDGRAFAYAALPPDAAAPSRGAPADLWLASLTDDAAPRRLASDIDLLVPAVWSADSATLVFRRSATQSRLVALDLASGAERPLVAAPPNAALFPVAFAPDGRLLYVALTSAGSDLYAVATDEAAPRHIVHLADTLTRDWALSPQGDRLAYLELSLSATNASSRAHVLDLASGAIVPFSTAPGNDLGPVWRADGSLAVGRFEAAVGRVVIEARDGTTSRLTSLAAGFDVPLAWSAVGDLLVRTFEGASVVAPGRSHLALIDADGRRRPVSTGDTTPLGWAAP